MAQIHVGAERTIAAPADRVYSCIADYHQHPNILPPAFSDLKIVEGGIGAGTVITFTLKTAGRERNYRMRVDEPEPGHILTESDEDSSLVTTFTVTSEGSSSRTRIDTRWDGATGIGGFMERTFAPRVLRKLYAEELELLEQYAQKQTAPGS